MRYDSEAGDFVRIEGPDGTTRVFKPTKKGLYASQFIEPSNEVVMDNTVDQNLESFTKRDIKRAKQARRLMAILGRPSEQQFKKIIGRRQLMNCETTEQDNVHNIYGPDVGSLKGKTTRQAQPHVELNTRPVTPDFLERHRKVTVCFDLMYINSMPFEVSVSWAIKFVTAEAIENII